MPGGNDTSPRYLPVKELDGIDLTLPLPDNFRTRFRSFFQSGEPVIIRGGVAGAHEGGKNRMAMENWQDLDYLVERVTPNHVCDVELGAYNQGQIGPMHFVDYVDYIRLWKERSRDNPSIPLDHILYMAQNDIPEILLDEIQLPSLCSDGTIGEGKLYSVKIWMGPGGTLSPLHNDPMENCLMQIVGRKRFYLLPRTTNVDCLYTGSNWDQQPNTSAVDIENPNLGRFPRFREAMNDLSTGELYPGDVLYIPSKMWHAVRSLDFSISVNAWWR